MASLAQRMAGAMKADVRTFEEVEKDPAALGQAVAVIVIAGFAALIGNIFRDGLAGGLGNLLATLIGYAVWAGLVVLIGTKVMPEPTTKADFSEAFRVVGFAASPGVFYVIAIIPFLGPLISTCISIWMLVVMVVAVRSVLDYTSTARAFVVCLIGFVVYLILYLMVLLPLLTARAILG
ncbi:MAG TPA: YIP1 family protein [Vicinamibacterales bacterium]|nr:YIP1 family protein [Vicinamibacterales bacterium]